MALLDLLQERREEILAIATKHGAFNVRVFGSVVRREETVESDRASTYLILRRVRVE